MILLVNISINPNQIRTTAAWYWQTILGCNQQGVGWLYLGFRVFGLNRKTQIKSSVFLTSSCLEKERGGICQWLITGLVTTYWSQLLRDHSLLSWKRLEHSTKNLELWFVSCVRKDLRLFCDGILCAKLPGLQWLELACGLSLFALSPLHVLERAHRKTLNRPFNSFSQAFLWLRRAYIQPS